MNISKLSVNRPVFVFMVFIAILVLGVVSLSRIGLDLFPDINFPVVAVITEYPDVGPFEVESQVTEPLEGAVGTVNGIERITSTSTEGSSLVIIEFTWGTDVDQAASDVRERVDLVRNFLPDDAERPTIVKFDPSIIPVMIFGMSGMSNIADMRRLAEEKVKGRLEQLDGVASAAINGGLEQAILVDLQIDKMQAYGLGINQVVSLLRSENLNLPVGQVQQGRTRYITRTLGELESIDQIRDIVVGNRGNVATYLKDVAEIVDGFKDKSSIVRINGVPGITIAVQKQAGKNTVRVAEEVNVEIAKIKNSLPGNVFLESIFDQADIINKSISSVAQTAIYGGLLAIIIIFVFLRNTRSTFIIAVAIPLSIIATFILMNFSNISINIISLGGLALGIGLLVDSSIVVLENIYRHRGKHENPQEAAIEGSSEVGSAIIASTLTTVVIFLPIAFVEGIAGALFRDMALTVAFSLMASLVVALSLIPMLASKFLYISKREEGKSRRLGARLSHSVDRFFSLIDGNYHGLLKWALGHRKWVVVIAIVVMLGSLALVPLVGTEFLPEQDQGSFVVDIDMPVGTALEATDEVAAQLEQLVVDNVAELKVLQATVGSADSFFGVGGSGSHIATIRVALVDLSARDKSVWEIQDDLRKKIGPIPGAKITVTQEGGGGPFGGGAPVTIDIRGYDLDRSKRLAEQVKGIVERVEGTRNVQTSIEEGNPELQIRVDRPKASALGLNVSTIARVLRSSVSGTTATRYRKSGEEFDIVVRLRKEDRESIEDLERIFVTTPSGEAIPLSNIAAVIREEGPVSINHKGQQRLLTVTAELFRRPLGQVRTEIEAELENLLIPSGFEVGFSGSAEDLQESFASLGLALLLAIFLVYAVMAAQFESLIDPFIVMFSLPLSIVGVVLLFLLTGTVFSVNAFIGIIMLAGIVVNNAIVLVDYINRLRKGGMELYDAVLEAGRTRLRPILMTALTTILALVPMGLELGEGSEVRAPLARAVIGGLSTSTILTLVFVPVMYTIFETISLRFKARREKRRMKRLSEEGVVEA